MADPRNAGRGSTPLCRYSRTVRGEMPLSAASSRSDQPVFATARDRLHRIARARPGDTVLVAGKGHEQGQDIAGVIRPFDDRQVLREAIQKTQG